MSLAREFCFLSDFTNQFIKALKTLEGIKKTDHLSVRQNAFYKFYKEFGTHYFIESKFGGKLVIETEYSKSEVSSIGNSSEGCIADKDDPSN